MSEQSPQSIPLEAQTQVEQHSRLQQVREQAGQVAGRLLVTGALLAGPGIAHEASQVDQHQAGAEVTASTLTVELPSESTQIEVDVDNAHQRDFETDAQDEVDTSLQVGAALEAQLDESDWSSVTGIRVVGETSAEDASEDQGLQTQSEDNGGPGGLGSQRRAIGVEQTLDAFRDHGIDASELIQQPTPEDPQIVEHDWSDLDMEEGQRIAKQLGFEDEHGNGDVGAFVEDYNMNPDNRGPIANEFMQPRLDENRGVKIFVTVEGRAEPIEITIPHVEAEEHDTDQQSEGQEVVAQSYKAVMAEALAAKKEGRPIYVAREKKDQDPDRAKSGSPVNNSAQPIKTNGATRADLGGNGWVR